MKEGHELFACCMFTLFKIFSIVLVDGDRIVRTDIQRTESRYIVEQM